MQPPEFLGGIAKSFMYKIGQNFPSLVVTTPQAIPFFILVLYSLSTENAIYLLSSCVFTPISPNFVPLSWKCCPSLSNDIKTFLLLSNIARLALPFNIIIWINSLIWFHATFTASVFCWIYVPTSVLPTFLFTSLVISSDFTFIAAFISAVVE